MNAVPGWYPDAERAPGDLRYWDGRRWTEHRVAAPRPMTGISATSCGLVSWMVRHKASTAVLVVLLMAFGGSLLPDEGPVDTAGAAARTDQDAPEPAEKAEPPAQAASDDREEEEPGTRSGTNRRPDGAAGAAEPPVEAEPKPRRRTFHVARVIDGDTIELANGETVRLVGIDTPEVGECGFEAASTNLSQLVLGEHVELRRSDEDRDGYGRLLRYVDVAGSDAGLALIRNGRAIAAFDSRDGYGFHPREPRYVAADRGTPNLCPMATGQHPTPKPAAPRPQPLVGSAGGAGCAAGYSPCVPPGPDLDCPDVDGPIRVTGSDPHGLDADGDGIACES